MKATQRPPRRDGGPTWLWWWVRWALILFWPLCFGLVAVEAAWLLLIGGIAALAWAGRRRAARKR